MANAQKDQGASTPVAGGQYLSERNADGTWNVYDVPIFAAHERFGFSFDRAWQEKAVANAQALAASGYVAPAHVHHHELFVSPQVGVERAGFYLPKRVEERSYPWSAGAVATTIADLLKIEDATYQEIAAGKLPYLSVEIRGEEFDPEKAAFNGLALLPHEAPYFRFPLLTVGAELAPDESKSTEPLAASAPTVAFYTAPSGGPAALFKLGGIMSTAAKPAAKPTTKPAPAPAPKPAAFSAGTLDAAKLQEVISKAVASAVTAALSELGAPEAPKDEKPKADDQPAPAPDVTDPVEDVGPAEAPIAAPAPQALAASAPSHALELRLKVLEGELATTKRAQKQADVVGKAAAQVVGYGSGDWNADLIAAFAAGGEPAVKVAVGIIKSGATPRPPETFTGEIAAPNEPPEVTAYAMAGQSKYREARRMHAVYDASPSWVKAKPLAAYIASQMGPPPAPKGN